MKLQSITPNLMVEDVQQTINYYRGVLSFKLISTIPAKGESFVRALLRKDDVEIMIQEEENLKKKLPEIRHEDIGGGGTIYIKMKGVKEYHDFLYNSGDIMEELKDSFHGTMEFTIRDINGYYLTFAESIEKE